MLTFFYLFLLIYNRTLKNNKLGGSIPTDLIKLKKLEVM